MPSPAPSQWLTQGETLLSLYLLHIPVCRARWNNNKDIQNEAHTFSPQRDASAEI